MISCSRCLSYLSPMSHLILNLSGFVIFIFQLFGFRDDFIRAKKVKFQHLLRDS